MKEFKFQKELYSKVALIKAAYNYTDVAFIHLDSDEHYYYVRFELKEGKENIDENEFLNEMLTQSVRHEVYKQTKGIRELLVGRALATSVVVDEDEETEITDEFSEDEILKDWFANNEESEN